MASSSAWRPRSSRGIRLRLVHPSEARTRIADALPAQAASELPAEAQGAALCHSAAQVEIATRREGGHFAVGDGTLEHPEAAIGMDPTEASGAEDAFGTLDGPCDFLGRFDAIDLHIDHADADLDLRADIFERLQIFGQPMRHFQHEVVHVELVEEAHQRAPLAFLNSLAPIVAEAEMHRALAVEGIEDRVNGSGNYGGQTI